MNTLSLIAAMAVGALSLSMVFGGIVINFMLAVDNERTHEDPQPHPQI